MHVIEARLKDPAGCVCEPSAADLYLKDGTCPLGLNAEGQECVCFDQCADQVSEQIVLQEVAAEEPQDEPATEEEIAVEPAEAEEQPPAEE